MGRKQGGEATQNKSLTCRLDQAWLPFPHNPSWAFPMEERLGWWQQQLEGSSAGPSLGAKGVLLTRSRVVLKDGDKHKQILSRSGLLPCLAASTEDKGRQALIAPPASIDCHSPRRLPYTFLP